MEESRSANKRAHSTQRKTKNLLKQLRILTPDALVRFDIIVSMLKISIRGQKEDRPYRRARELFTWHMSRSYIYRTIDLLLKESVIESYDPEWPHDRFKFTDKGKHFLKKEIMIWGDIRKLRPISKILSFGIEKVTELLHELDRVSKSGRSVNVT